MELIFTLVVLVYTSYFIGCLLPKNKYKFLCAVFFVGFGFLLRNMIAFHLTKDYDAYIHYFSDSFVFVSWVDYISKEPYLYILYRFFGLFFSSNETIFAAIYYLNFFLITTFFVWLMFVDDVRTWKKNIFFTLFYFLFAHVLLRNGAQYVIFAYFIYLIYRNRNTYLIFLTPFIHLTSSAPIILVFHRWKYYRWLLLAFVLLLIPMLFLGKFANIPLLHTITYRIVTYSQEYHFSLAHYVFFATIIGGCAVAYYFLRKRFWNPIIITTLIIYLLSFLISPIAGFRYSPYLLMSLLFIKVEEGEYVRLNTLLDYGSVVLLGYFFYSLIDTHSNDLLLQNFSI